MIEFKKWYIHIWSNRLVRIGGRFVGLGKEGMAFGFWPFLVVRKNLQNDPVLKELINHEKIHLVQQLELGIIFAPLMYVGEYLYARYILKLSQRASYYFISLEQEAHINAPNLLYLQKRKMWSVFYYMRHKKNLQRDTQGVLVISPFKTER